MRHGLTLTTLLLAATVLFSRPSEAFNLDEYQSGNWTVYAWADDSTGNFSYCGMETTFTDGSSVIIAVFDDGIEMWLNDPKWNLEPGLRTSASVQIDRRYDAVKPAIEEGLTRLTVLFGSDIDFLNAFRLGLSMTISVPGSPQFPVDLTGTNHATEALAVCWDIFGSDVSPFR